MTDGAAAPSPCNNVCRMDDATGWCEGCLRTLDEIARWSAMADDERLAVRARLDERRRQLPRSGAMPAVLEPGGSKE